MPGTGTPASQVHDFNGGILASGLFWTVPGDDRGVWFSRDGRRAVLDLHDVPVVDSFQFFGPNQIAASVSVRVEWRATGPLVERGSGAAVPPAHMAAFLGEIAPARSSARCEGAEWGFSFHSGRADEEGGWAQVGRSRNGAFL